MEEEMTIGKYKRKHLIEGCLIFCFGMAVPVLFCPYCLKDASFFPAIPLFSGFIWVSLWKGNELIFELLDKKLPWLESPMKRLVINIIATISYTVLTMTLIIYLVFEISGVGPANFSFRTVVNYSGTAVVVTIIVGTFLSARGFFLSWRQLAVQHERLKRESLSSRYEVLKQQVNPHFLFNSLNVLTSLVYEDPDQSARFIKQLSNVYRYVLDAHGKEVVPLREEVAFLQSYFFLQQMRYGEKLTLEVDLGDSSGIFIAPLALQMLVENAIKHNETSTRHPLHIVITRHNGAIVVRNKLNKREVMAHEKRGIGLKNIQSRYLLLSDRPVRIKEKEDTFSVTLPELYSEV